MIGMTIGDVLDHKNKSNTRTRPLYEIAAEIERTWKNVSPYARPYLDAMHNLNRITDPFFCDSGESVVLYFLSNATGWRGPNAQQIKAELKLLLKAVR